MAALFSIVLFSSMAACVHAVYKAEKKTIQQAPGADVDGRQDPMGKAALRRMEERVLLILLIGCLCSVFVAASLARGAGKAASAMIQAANEMARGNLDVSFQTDDSGPMGELAQALNGLAVNLQEVLLFIWRETQKSADLLDAIFPEAKSQAGPGSSVEALRESLAQLRYVVGTFELYGVSLSDELGRVLEKGDNSEGR